jgi:hypothetical protein
MRLDSDTVSYFKSISEETGIPYQGLTNLYLGDRAVNQQKLLMKWHPKTTSGHYRTEVMFDKVWPLG